MKHLRITLLISSFAIAISGGLFSVSETHAAELLPSFINTAVAKEETQETLTLEQRTAILKEIVSASQNEVKNLTEKLTALELGDDWNIARELFLTRLATSSEHYTSLEKQLGQETISLEEVKTIAKDLKDWRETVYTPELKVVGNMILIFQTDDVRRIVQARNEKIASDIKKLDRQKLVNTDTLKKYLAQADKSIKNATALNAKAKELYFTETVEPLQPKTLQELGQESLIENTPASEASQPEEAKDVSSSAKATADKQDEIRELAKESLKELKNAYELFFKMNDRIRK